MRTSAVFLAAASLVSATSGLLGAPCWDTCQMVLWPIMFNDTAGSSPSPPTRQCQGHMRLFSLYLCSKLHCSVGERTTNLQALNTTCQAQLNVSVPSFDLIADYTDERISQLRRIQKSEYENGATFQDVGIPTDYLFRLAHDTLASWQYAYRYHYWYAGGMFIFWGIVVAIGLLNRALSTLAYKTNAQTRLSKRTRSDSISVASEDDGLLPPRASRLARLAFWLRARLIVPAVFGYRKAQPFGWYTVPPRIESLTILSFILMNILFTIHGYHVFPDNL
jgi:hypothetical protein